MFLRNEDLRKLGIGVLQDLQDFFSEEGGTGEGPGGGTLNLIVWVIICFLPTSVENPKLVSPNMKYHAAVVVMVTRYFYLFFAKICKNIEAAINVNNKIINIG
jgi:hypothetical protein